MRTYVVTGSASGVGAAVAAQVVAQGDRVIGVDLRDADVLADLSTAEGRAHMVAQVLELSGGVVDVVVANAGLSNNSSTTMAVNYYGAIATLEGLRPALAKSSSPRAVVTASIASLQAYNEELLELVLEGTEADAMKLAEELSDPRGYANYPTSKRAVAKWLRRNAPTPEWAGAGIALNAIAPGIIKTPMTEGLFADPVQRENMLKQVPMPLNGPTDAATCASVIMFLGSEANTHVTGQVVFVDGGMDATVRGDQTW